MTALDYARIFFFSGLYFLALLVAFHLGYDASPDFYDYRNHYEQARYLSFFDQRFEPLYFWLTKFFIGIPVGFEVFVSFILGFSAILKIAAVTAISPKAIGSFFTFYFVISFVIFDMISWRANLGLAFFLLSLAFFFSDRISYRFLGTSLLAIASHYSYVIPYVFLLLGTRFVNKGSILILAALLCLFFSAASFLEVVAEYSANPLLAAYMEEEKKAGSIFSSYSIFIGVLFFIGLFYRRRSAAPAQICFITAIFMFAFVSALSWVPVLYFRYIDICLVLLLLYNCLLIEASTSLWRKFFISLSLLAFSIFKLLSYFLFSPVLLL